MGEDSYLDSYWESQTEYLDHMAEQAMDIESIIIFLQGLKRIKMGDDSYDYDPDE